MPTRANALAIMAKAPAAGRVKTRLVPPLSYEQAAELYRALLLDQLANLKNFTAAERYIAYAPDDVEALMRDLGGSDYQYLPQRGDDLGARMEHLFSDLQSRGHSRIILIGSDLPALPLQILNDAFTRLSSPDTQVVLGPSEDGGYYLVGMNQPTAAIFENMTWSHDRVLAQTTERLTRLGVGFGLTRRWFDLDTIDDLRRLLDPAVAAEIAAMPHTRSCLDSLRAWVA
ncbi:MAG TPA: TIGR04282 family arsenosugar biosynthesis glycosyltransferase [Candidatus Binatia bacterium]